MVTFLLCAMFFLLMAVVLSALLLQSVYYVLAVAATAMALRAIVSCVIRAVSGVAGRIKQWHWERQAREYEEFMYWQSVLDEPEEEFLSFPSGHEL